MENQVRVRFAPSPTGPLHIGGVRTALFNYLFAKKQGGTMIVRIEDTDQARFVPGAEEYIKESLEWCGIVPDESPWSEGKYGPYRQSERKAMYRQYAEQLIASGHAYHAFDTAQELEAMRERLKEARVVSPQYNAISRTTMKNSLTLSEEEVKEKLENGTPYVIRLKVPSKDEVRLNDMVRGWVKVHTSTIDDKILLKSDGMPTYHLANVVDDHLMKITHVIRGEEWLPSAPLHVLLYKYLGWEATMPQFAHLPLLLKPDGNGKLSKRDGDKLGFSVFPIEWKDPTTGAISTGYREDGFLPDAFTNFLAFLGWNPGTEQELFSLDELIEAFSVERINKAGTKFDFEKAKWFNQQYLKSKPDEELAKSLMADLQKAGIEAEEKKAVQIAGLLKERVTFPHEFYTSGKYFFALPESYDEKITKKKWKADSVEVFKEFAEKVTELEPFSGEAAKETLNDLLASKGMGLGKVMQALRLSLTGTGAGPDIVGILDVLGASEIAQRIHLAIEKLGEGK